MPRTSNDPLVKDFEGLNKIVENGSVAGLRSAQSFIPRYLYALQKRLSRWRYEETLLLQRIRRDLDIDQIEEERADYFLKIKTMQAYLDYGSGWPDPHERLNYDRNKLMSLSIGIRDQMSELDRYGHLIKDTQAKIKQLRDLQDKVTKALKDSEISEEEVQKDQIAQRELSEVFLLYDLHVEFREASTKEDGTRGYTQDPKTVLLLNQIQLRFVAFAERSPWVIDGDLDLDLFDPGSDQNKKNLTILINILRSTTKTDRVETGVRKYVDSMRRNLNDKFISENVGRRTVSTNQPEQGDSMLTATNNLGKFLNFTNTVGWWMSLDNGTFIAAAENWFKYKTSALYGGRPICGQEGQETGEEDSQKESKNELDIAEAAGRELYQKELSKVAGGLKNIDTSVPDEVIEQAKILYEELQAAQEEGDEDLAAEKQSELEALVQAYPDLNQLAISLEDII